VLATDLTSFLQVGDAFVRNTSTGRTGLFEVKTGDENEHVLRVLSSVSPEKFEQRLAQYLDSSKNPHHALKQVQRNLMQHRRMARSSTYLNSDRAERVDLMSDEVVSVVEVDVVDEMWSDVVRERADGLDEVDAATGVVDGCLFFEYGTGPHTVRRDLYFRYRVNKYLGLPLAMPALRRLFVVDVAQSAAMPGFLPQSTSLFLGLGAELQSRLLALDDHLMVYLHVPDLAALITANGAALRVRNMRAAEQPYADRLIRDLFGANKAACLTSERWQNGGSSFWLEA
jgi:hypothetical protein